MKINPVELNKIDSVYETSLKTGEGHATGSREAGLPRDRVYLSDEAEKQREPEDTKALAVREAEQNTDPEKLRRIKAAIENGTYRVSGEDIADAMIDRL
ncbi:MAG: flagellar biosynthesis anti-sigma factor FlgM [Clostridiaceae bacterium]|nr:flagellar biosynthesis anti-sigma factor FlgM [Clostridiaceae bacterium]